MLDETSHNDDSPGFLPIPTYDEAILVRPSSSQSTNPEHHTSPSEHIPFFENRQRRDGYRRPEAESARSSMDFDHISQTPSRTSSTEDLRREIEQMDIIEPEGRQFIGTGRFSKHFTTLSHTLSSLQLPTIPQWLPSWARVREILPHFQLNWIILGRFLALVLVLTLAYFLFLSNVFRGTRHSPGMKWFDPEVLRNYVQDHIDGTNIHERMQYYSNYTHLAGTSGSEMQALYTEAVFAEYLQDVQMEQFDIYLNFPIDGAGARRVAILEPQNFKFEAHLEEDTIYPDAWKKQTPSFHGYSYSGIAQGPLIYANYGNKDDFQQLRDKGINITSSIVLMRLGLSQLNQASMVHQAELAGAAGCLIYQDSVSHGSDEGSALSNNNILPEDGLHRGTVALTSRVLGDPLSPGYASHPDEAKRSPKVDNPGLVGIPSLPLSLKDARELLKALKGFGVPSEQLGAQGEIQDVEYWSGDSSSPVVLLKNEQEEVERRPIFNVLGRIRGVEQPEKKIIVGNHRDAWCFGAGGSNGGAAVMLEVIRILSSLRDLGWRPLRTVEFASWDAGEFNLAGSTEHVEAQLDAIRADAFAYLNVDVIGVGEEFRAAASPLLSTALLHVLDRFTDTEQNKTLRTMFVESGNQIGGLDASSDHAPFQMLGGCSSLDMGYGKRNFPMHNSCYDTLDWLEKYGDNKLERHKRLAQILALLILDLSDRDILPFDFEAFAATTQEQVRELGEDAKVQKAKLDLGSLRGAADEMSTNGRLFMEWSQGWSNTVYGVNEGFEGKTLAIKRVSHNIRMANFETNLLDLKAGLPGREQYRHVLVAPSLWDAHATSTFPGVRDALEEDDERRAQQQLDLAAERLLYAAKKLLY